MYSDKEKIRAMAKYIECCGVNEDSNEQFVEMSKVVMDGYINPCPFCGGDNVRIVTGAEMGDVIYSGFLAVVCDFKEDGCGATGGYRETQKGAIEVWNKRV